MRRDDEYFDPEFAPTQPPSMRPGTELSGMGMDMPMAPPPPPGMEGGLGEDMMMDEMAPPDLPQSATVVSIEGDSVTIEDDMGEILTLSIDSFPYPPEEGQMLVQAEVVEVAEGMIIANVIGLAEPVTLPMDILVTDFNVGDFFWMPEPPGGPEQLMAEDESFLMG